MIRAGEGLANVANGPLGEIQGLEVRAVDLNPRDQTARRGGARSKKSVGFSKGSERSASRGGGGAGASRKGERGGGDRDVDRDDLDDAHTSDEEKVGAAIVGGVVGMYRYNFETIELLRGAADDWSRQAAKRGHRLDTYVSEVAFGDLGDLEERDFFNGVATSFDLDDETIDRLIEVGGRLLRESPEFRSFMARGR
jgi:hypothetical protein